MNKPTTQPVTAGKRKRSAPKKESSGDKSFDDAILKFFPRKAPIDK